MDRNDTLRLIKDHDLKPVKGRGQNFLCDPKVVEVMADAAEVAHGDRVVEVGPGLGILTEELLDKGARVLAVELDPKLARIVRERVTSGSLDVLRGDALGFSNDELASRLDAGEGEYKVVANLPYSITSDAIRKFISERPRPSSFTVMVQREVADRITASPPKMSLLSVAVQVYGEPRKLMNVPAGSFHPKPKVDSAVLHVRLYDDAEIQEKLSGIVPEKLLDLVKTGFAERRKQLKNTLVGRYPKDALERAFAAAEIQPKERPERLTVSDWVRLAAALIH
ncbi:MAG: 16S rRNA (adenine(1518)-N(6)/adenine(1519)-N(6))-dimethyltransferase RsmA [Patescibacteria group bacterium]|nr:16S rRNA (adenine(1518)-N(6)/adenine(1519)-N(6))-dimethyltransferase RsmA [Patescibacteria group bacterium]